MKKKLIISTVVIGISIISSAIAYAGGGWTYEEVTLPAYQGYRSTSYQTKWTSDGAAKTVKYSQPAIDANFCARYYNGGNFYTIGSRGYLYSTGMYGYSNYLVSPNTLVGNRYIFLQFMSTNSYATDHNIDIYWSPDQP